MSRVVVLGLVLLLVLVVAIATSGGPDEQDAAEADDPATPPSADATPDGPADFTGMVFPPAPEVPDGPISAATRTAIEELFDSPLLYAPEEAEALAETGDPRVLWLVSDLMRFVSTPEEDQTLREVAEALSGLDLADASFGWGPLTDHLLAWDLPAPDGYREYKAALFTAVEDGWAPFFADAESTIDWRQVSWGGVFIDDREFGDPRGCPGGCIPSLDVPALTPAEEGFWYPDGAIVFGVEINGEAVAFPKNIMEVHEMVNTTIGGRDVAIPYCTLCGSAQVFFTDIEGGGTGEIVMRTSGLLRRSNKVMYDLTTSSVFDTFTGEAVSGPLREQGITLDQATVVTSTWGEWRAAHPDTMIVASDGGIDRNYPLDPLQGRDDDGPIFPIGVVDPRLGVHDQVLGVELPDGTFVAFPVEAALAALGDGEAVELAGITVTPDAGGLVATVDGEPIASHQAFWFAWSQFHPDTLLWEVA